jgi:hypothetical protein
MRQEKDTPPNVKKSDTLALAARRTFPGRSFGYWNLRLLGIHLLTPINVIYAAMQGPTDPP